MHTLQYIVLNKTVGETPLMALQKWKGQHPAYADTPAAYAGRLDPMASGKLLILLGDECKRQRAYTNLDKEYEIEVLLDVGSDTGDILGIPEDAHKESSPDAKSLTRAIRNEIGAHLRLYPAFSSKTVDGKPLFLHALSGTLSHITIPEHLERIYAIRLLNISTLHASELETRISGLLERVPLTTEPSKRLGEDFRIAPIRAHWKSLFKTARDRKFVVLQLRITCASGTYMRSFAGHLGETLGTKALALSIHRTKIGTYFSLLRTGFWIRIYS